MSAIGVIIVGFGPFMFAAILIYMMYGFVVTFARTITKEAREDHNLKMAKYERMGIDPSRVHKVNPQIYIRRDGTWAGIPGYEYYEGYHPGKSSAEIKRSVERKIFHEQYVQALHARNNGDYFNPQYQNTFSQQQQQQIQQQIMQDQMQQSIDWAMEQSRLSVTPFEQGGYNMDPGMNPGMNPNNF